MRKQCTLIRNTQPVFIHKRVNLQSRVLVWRLARILSAQERLHIFKSDRRVIGHVLLIPKFTPWSRKSYILKTFLLTKKFDNKQKEKYHSPMLTVHSKHQKNKRLVLEPEYITYEMSMSPVPCPNFHHLVPAYSAWTGSFHVELFLCVKSAKDSNSNNFWPIFIAISVLLKMC